MVQSSTVVAEKPKLIFLVFKLALFWTIISILFIAPISIGGFRLKAFQDFYFKILFAGTLAESIFGYVYVIGYFILLPIIASTVLGILSVYFRKFAFLLLLMSPLLIILGMILMVMETSGPSGMSSSKPSELVAALMSMLTPLLTIVWLSINHKITSSRNVFQEGLKTGIIIFVITTLLAMTFPFITSYAYSKARQKELIKIKSENTFFKRPMYLPSNVTIRSNEELVVDEGLSWPYSCRVQSGGSATLYIRQIPIGGYAHNLAWFEGPEFQKNRQEQFSEATVNGRKALYSEPTQNYGWRSLRWESNGIFLEIASDYSCSHSKNDLIKIAESMERL